MKTQVDTGGGSNPSLSKVVPNNTSNPTSYRVVLLCATFSLLLGCILKGDDPKLTDIQSKLDQNRKKWLSKMVSNYEFNFRWHCFCFENFIEPVSISLRENRIVDVDFVADDVPFAIRGFDDYRTIEGLFDFVQEAIDEKADSISAEYHSELGYPIEVWIDYEEDYDDDEKGCEIDSLIIDGR